MPSIGRRRRRKRSALSMPVKQHSIVTWEQNHVRAAVVELAQGVGEMLGVAAAPVHGVDPSCRPDIDRWVAGCGRALTQAEDMTPAVCGRKIVPDHVTMSIPGPITLTLPVKVSWRRRNPKQGITLGEMSHLMVRGYRKAQDLLGTRFRDLRVDFVSGAVSGIQLDGQTVLDPIGLHGQQLGLEMSFCLAPIEWIRALQEVARQLNLNLTAIAPDHTLCAAAATDYEALLVSLYDDATLLSLVRCGRIAWSASLEQGERQLLASVASKVDASLGERTAHQPDALIRAFRSGTLLPHVSDQVSSAFWETLRSWMSSMAGQYRQKQSDSWAPHHIYAWDVTRRLPEAAMALDTPFWERLLPFERCPEIVPLDAPMVPNVLDRSGQGSDRTYLVLRALARHLVGLFVPTASLDRTLAAIIASGGKA